MQIAISGSHGLVGSELVAELERQGRAVRRIVRGTAAADQIAWDPAAGTIDLERLEGLDAIVHLAGENIAEGRWTAAKKGSLRDSRVQGTRTISEGLAQLKRKPRVLVCASAIGYYGDRPGETCDENSRPGEGFLPELCVAWEAASRPAAEAGMRVVRLRTGVVLSTKGGALAKMLLPFKLGLGGIVGSGRQYWSWITIDDLVRAILFAIDKETMIGPANCVTPHAVTNREFTKTLGRVLHRPTIIPMPAFAARLALGEMANDLLLGDNHIVPCVLQDAGFLYKFPQLEPALRHLLS